jgi:hypothetical protein
MIAASRALRASGGELDEEIESDGDRDEHVEFEIFLSSLDEQPSDAEFDEDRKKVRLFKLISSVTHDAR